MSLGVLGLYYIYGYMGNICHFVVVIVSCIFPRC